ncbi:MAG: restriction endonuclease subunit S [Bacteroidales bacterium]|nr:restriction endonuclease subunit S [Bacteroidales bacterium]
MEYKRLGDYIRPVDVRNRDLKVNLSQGICNAKYFQNPKQVADNPETHKIVRTGQFAYNRATTRNGEKISIALREGPDCTVSSAYQVFEIVDENQLDPKYLMMWFKRPEFDRLAIYYSHGSAHEFFEWDAMCDVKLPVPPINRQREIVAEYETLTRRIRLNEQMIAKLEETAQALYRKMFVDGIDKENLPEGWRMGMIEDLGDVVGGATPSTDNPTLWCENGISWLSPADLSKQATKFISRGAKDITELGYNSCSTKMLPKGSVLFSSRAPIGLMAIAAKDLCTNQGFKSIIPNEGVGTEYVYYYLKSIKDKIAEENTGSTFDEVSGQIMKGYSAIIPPFNITKEFSNLVQPAFNLQYNIEQENEKLTELQSLLLARMGKK